MLNEVLDELFPVFYVLVGGHHGTSDSLDGIFSFSLEICPEIKS
jgi:hypothetical protein